jgi:serine/threonine protein kinase
MMETTLAGRYQVVKPLGSGGFGQTFLAHDTHLPGNPLCVVNGSGIY